MNNHTPEPHDADLNDPDPVVVDAVTHIRDRFGVGGLRSLIDLAQRELANAEEALRALADEAADERPVAGPGSGPR